MREYFDKDLVQLNDQLIEMGSIVEQAIKNTLGMITGVRSGSLEQARVYEDSINTIEKTIQNHCIKLLLHQAPVAKDLRCISAVLKMITDLERIGDHAIDIAEIAQYLIEKSSVYDMTHISDMAEQAAEMVTLSIDAFVRKDIELAKKVSRQDDIIDALFEKVKEETVDIVHRNRELGTEAIDLVMIAKYLERIGDHAVNTAEWVAFSITGSRRLK